MSKLAQTVAYPLKRAHAGNRAITFGNLRNAYRIFSHAGGMPKERCGKTNEKILPTYSSNSQESSREAYKKLVQ